MKYYVEMMDTTMTECGKLYPIDHRGDFSMMFASEVEHRANAQHRSTIMNGLTVDIPTLPGDGGHCMRYAAKIGYTGRQLGRIFPIAKDPHHEEFFVDGNLLKETVYDPPKSDLRIEHKFYDYVVLEIPE